ncbi:MAG: hypothetical protein ACTSUB_03295 [Candidatus Thorarchaeota archaeon]
MVKSPGIPPQIIGQFFGVGSIGETEHQTPLEYITSIPVPYAFQVTSNHDEDMIRQFASVIDGFEDEGEFLLDVDLGIYREVVGGESPLFLEKKNFPSMYLLPARQSYEYFKTQLTAPSTMCFSTRGSDGKQLVSPQMFRFYSMLMKRLAIGFVKQLEGATENIILCQDDPALAYVINMIDNDQAGDLTVQTIMKTTDGIYPSSVIPAYHYCDDWRKLQINGWYPIWDSIPKIVHIDLVRYNPELDTVQAEKINKFLEKGGGLALGVLPNVDDAFSSSVVDTLRNNLAKSIDSFVKSGVNADLLSSTSMISTQCGLSGASSKLTREIHSASEEFPDIFKQAISKVI